MLVVDLEASVVNFRLLLFFFCFSCSRMKLALVFGLLDHPPGAGCLLAWPVSRRNAQIEGEVSHEV